MQIARRLAGWLALLVASAGQAHPAPNSTLRLQFLADTVRAEYWLPKSELTHARAADQPAPDLPAYLLRHLAAQTADGKAWRITVEGVREATYLDHAYVVAELTLTPPPGAAATPFVLIGDAVTHEVRNHVLYVVGNRGEDSRILGALQYPARRLAIAR